MEVVTLFVSLLVAFAYCAQAITEAMIGPVLPDLARTRGFDVAALAVLIPAYNVGGSLGTAFGGMAFDRVADESRLPRGAISFLAVVMIFVASFAAAMSVPAGREVMIVISFCQGCCGGVFRTGANWMMMRLHDKTAGPWISTIHFCSGVGRWWAGLLGSYFISTDNLPGAFLSGAVIVLGVAVPLLVVAFSVSGSSGGASLKDTTETEAKPGSPTATAEGADLFLYMLASFVFVIMGVQNSFQYLVTSYAVAASPPLEYHSTSLAALLSASYGFAFAASRLLSIPAAVYFPDPLPRLQLSVVVSLGALVAITTQPASGSVLETGSMALGLALAPAFPTAINYGKQTLGPAMTGGKLSLLMSAGTFGGVFVPQLAGQFVSGGGKGAYGPEVMMQMMSTVCLAGGVLLMVSARVVPKTDTKTNKIE